MWLEEGTPVTVTAGLRAALLWEPQDLPPPPAPKAAASVVASQP